LGHPSNRWLGRNVEPKEQTQKVKQKSRNIGLKSKRSVRRNEAYLTSTLSSRGAFNSSSEQLSECSSRPLSYIPTISYRSIWPQESN